MSSELERGYREMISNKPTKTEKIIGDLIASNANFQKISLFSPKPLERSVVSKSPETEVLLSVSTDAIQELYNSNLQNTSIILPGLNNESLNLLLNHVQVYAEGYEVRDGDGNILDLPKVHSYFGIVEGVANSYVILNIFPDHLTAIVRVENEPYELRRSSESRATSDYVMQKGQLLGLRSCGAKTHELVQSLDKTIQARAPLNKYIRLYFDSQDSNNTDVTSLFTAVQYIYINDPDVEVNVYLAGMTLWTSGTRPWFYSGADGLSLDAYSVYRISNPIANADAYQFTPVDNDQSGAGIAWVGTLCSIIQPNVGPFGISIVASGLTPLPVPFPPTFSLNAAVVAHELGHNCGARHTFDCVWTGVVAPNIGLPNQSLGGCDGACISCASASPSGVCTQPGDIPEGRTIMGYCSNYSPMVFGPQPGAVVRDFVNNAQCLLCVHPNTLILMADGTHRQIRDLKRGDEVFTDLSRTKTYKIAKVSIASYDPCEKMDVVVMEANCLGSNMPSERLIITGGHAIFYRGLRREARCFKNFPGVKYYESVEGEDLFEISDKFMVDLYDLQFEDDGSYVAAGVQIQSRSPWSEYTPLPKELYFDLAMYREERTFNSFNQSVPFDNTVLEI